VSTAIPPRLLALLSGSPFEPATLGFTRACEEILVDNKMPFFPAFTDHGLAHVEAVLKACERLVPDRVWDNGLLGPEDAAVLIAACFLHDLALHTREAGFVALVSDSSPHKPLPWFSTERPDRSADEPWPELWQNFKREARQFSQSELDRLLGPVRAGVPSVALEEDLAPERWTDHDRLLIGEFIRRNHARLAHEIALYGFPGIAGGTFPVLGETLASLADAVGVTARSHNEDLRLAAEYLQYKQPGDLRPDGAVLLYLMGLLRIADYFQLEAGRAPALLLHLREPQSPQSIAEWRKHEAVQQISWEHKDPQAVSIQVSAAHGIRTYLQLTELVDDLQRELDVTTAVLSETFGATDLAPLRLSRQRVRTNLREKSLHERLGFVPKRARLRSAEDLFRLVISDLYGNAPAVAGRELLQNAVDAVRELERWKARNGTEPAIAEFHDLPADVLVEERTLDDGMGELRVVDRGVGMTPATVIECFLTAGASFGAGKDEQEDLDAATAIRWMKTGRFGVGAFASFLLGSEVRVTTRHVSESRGISLTARLDDDLTQLDWVDGVPIGTEIVIPFSYDGIRRSGSQAPRIVTPLIWPIEAYYQLTEPGVIFRQVNREGRVIDRPGEGSTPDPARQLPCEWESVPAPDFDAVLWQLPARGPEPSGETRQGMVVHNGIAIQHAVERISRPATYQWSDRLSQPSLGRPNISVFDTRQRLGVTLNRYELMDPSLPFEKELLQSIGEDVVARALARGPGQHPLGTGWLLAPVVGRQQWFPLLSPLLQRYADPGICVLWVGDFEKGWDEFPFSSPFAGRFLKWETPGGQWRDPPFRAVLPAGGAYSAESKAERARWGLAHADFLTAIDDITSQFGLRPSVGAYVRAYGNSSRIAMIEAGGKPPDWLEDRRWQALTAHLTFSDRPPTQEQKDALAKVGTDLVAGQPDQAIGLAILHPADMAGKGSQAALASVWMDSVGGGLELASQDRDAQRAEIVNANPGIGRLVAKWEGNSPDST
jgi:molecular chaperone HtpG